MGMSPNEELAARFIACSRYLRNHRRGNGSQDQVIRLIGDNGGRMAQKDLRVAMGIRPASASELISKLCNYGLVERAQSERDGRSCELSLTKDGRRRYEELSGDGGEYDDVFACLTDEERGELAAILTKLDNEWLQVNPSILKRGCKRGAKTIRNGDGSRVAHHHHHPR